MAPPTSPIFNKDERVLCFHGELLYEAKILDTRPSEPESKTHVWQYKVHYKGWKHTWDDWVDQDRLRKFTDENKEFAAQLKKDMELNRPEPYRKVAATAPKKKGTMNDARSARGSEERHGSVAAAIPRGQKRGRDFETEKEDTFRNKPAVRINMPDKLKSILVDDWENVTKNLQLVSLPSHTPVNRVLDDYYDAEKEAHRNETDLDILEEVLAGLKEYFNKCLGRILLYRFERAQYHSLYKKMNSPTDELAGKQPTEVYGAEHLLRLLVSLPELLGQTNMDRQSVSRLREEILKLEMWLAKDENIAKYLGTEYENVTQDYTETVKGNENGVGR